MAKKKLSRDQKRKSKLAKRAKKHGPMVASLAYRGTKYKADKFTPVMFETELGIHQADVASDRSLNDHIVENALQRLVLQLRGPSGGDSAETGEAGGLESMIVEMIRLNWKNLFQSHPHPGKEALIGILRTLLGSIEVWKTPSQGSRGYLSFLEGFLRKSGVTVRGRQSDEEASDEWDEDSEKMDDADQLMACGQDWYMDNDKEAAVEFHERAAEMLAAGRADEVAEICQQLMGEAGFHPSMAEFSFWSIKAQQAMNQSRLDNSTNSERMLKSSNEMSDPILALPSPPSENK